MRNTVGSTSKTSAARNKSMPTATRSTVAALPLEIADRTQALGLQSFAKLIYKRPGKRHGPFQGSCGVRRTGYLVTEPRYCFPSPEACIKMRHLISCDDVKQVVDHAFRDVFLFSRLASKPNTRSRNTRSECNRATELCVRRDSFDLLPLTARHLLACQTIVYRLDFNKSLGCY